MGHWLRNHTKARSVSPAQLHFLNIALSSAVLSLSLALDGDLDQLSAGTSANIHAAGCDKLGLVVWVAAKDLIAGINIVFSSFDLP